MKKIKIMFLKQSGVWGIVLFFLLVMLFLSVEKCVAQEGSVQSVEISSYTMGTTAEPVAYGVMVSKRIWDRDDNTYFCDPSGESVLENLRVVASNPDPTVDPDAGTIRFIETFYLGPFVINDGNDATPFFVDFDDVAPDAINATFRFCFAQRFIMNEAGPTYVDPDVDRGDPSDHMRGEGKHVWDISESIKVVEADAGDVVVISRREDLTLVKSKKKFDTRVAGVISEDPKFYMGAPNPEQMADGLKPLALAGIVECKVTAENGPIRRGDLLVTSSLAGHAMRADSKKITPGMVIGSALESLEKGQGKINILVNQ